MKRLFMVLAILCLPVLAGAVEVPAEQDIMDYGQLEKRIEALSVKDMDGQMVALESLWTEKRIVLAFVRQFG